MVGDRETKKETAFQSRREPSCPLQESESDSASQEFLGRNDLRVGAITLVSPDSTALSDPPFPRVGDYGGTNYNRGGGREPEATASSGKACKDEALSSVCRS